MSGGERESDRERVPDEITSPERSSFLDERARRSAGKETQYPPCNMISIQVDNKGVSRRSIDAFLRGRLEVTLRWLMQ